MMVDLNYQKRKNIELFKVFEDSNTLFLSNSQNYIPIYNRFFSLNDTNFNAINLNHKWYISNVKERLDENKNIFVCKIKNVNTQKTKEIDVFFKMAPLLDPFKCLTGKIDITNKVYYKLPTITSDNSNTFSRYLDTNNSAYVDSFFVYLSSYLYHNHNFINGLDFYGSFLSIKNDFKLNVFDDLDYLHNCDYFIKHKNVLFKIDDYEHYFQNNICKKIPIKIEHNISLKSNISAQTFDDTIFEDVFVDTPSSNSKIIDLKDLSGDLVDITSLDNYFTCDKTTSLRSGSSFSSRTSHTSESSRMNESCENCSVEDKNGFENCDEERKSIENEKQKNESSEYSHSESDESDESEEEEIIEVTIPKFPVQIICMENCENTFDNLILSEELSEEEWLSAFIQIIMILITYQKAFGFTHNDLHTNNVMYNETEKKYIYYCYQKKIYKVPTFGRIFKIIDFGRGIYKLNGKLFCSDSFQTGNDAATQYNTEPYFNEQKPRLEPNFSFDLCRLACSIFDYIIDDMSDIEDIDNCDPLIRLIVEWCTDDNGMNVLYKNTGVERYPDFKLYKMIARCVHAHTPTVQLGRPEFSKFAIGKTGVPKGESVMNIDEMPSYIGVSSS